MKRSSLHLKDDSQKKVNPQKKQKFHCQRDAFHMETIQLLSICYPFLTGSNLNQLYIAHFGEKTTKLFPQSQRKPEKLLNSFSSAGLCISKCQKPNSKKYFSKIYWNGPVNIYFKAQTIKIVEHIIQNEYEFIKILQSMKTIQNNFNEIFNIETVITIHTEILSDLNKIIKSDSRLYCNVRFYITCVTEKLHVAYFNYHKLFCFFYPAVNLLSNKYKYTLIYLSNLICNKMNFYLFIFDRFCKPMKSPNETIHIILKLQKQLNKRMLFDIQQARSQIQKVSQ